MVCPSAPPPPGLASGRPGSPSPLARAPLQDLPRYYGLVRPCAIGTLPLAVSAAWGPPSCDQGANRTHFDWPSLSGRQVLLFRASACDELAPPLHRAPPRPQAGSSLAESTPQKARLCPGVTDRPRCHRFAFRCVSSGSHMFVFSSLTCPDPVGTFPQRSRPRLLTNAACGGLGPPPARRTRRATLHHWHSTLRDLDLLHRHHSASRTHNRACGSLAHGSPTFFTAVFGYESSPGPVGSGERRRIR